MIGAVDTLKFMTKGPSPPSRCVSCTGANKSSMLRCQISPAIGVFIDLAISAAFPSTVRAVKILAKRAD